MRAAPEGIARFPERDFVWGPATRFRLIRSGLAYLAITALGLTIAWFASAPAWQAFGLGLILPGGGFLQWAAGDGLSVALHGAAALMAFAVFGASLGLWFATGNAIAPPLIWLLLALIAAAMNHAQVWSGAMLAVPLLAGAVILVLTIAAYGLGKYGLHQRLAVNRTLMGVAFPASAAPAAALELAPDDLALLRLLYDRALQPLDRFDGFDWVEQFQTAAVRYQLNLMGYALALTQRTRLPAFQGYHSDAQRRLIQKQQDYRIWRYWQWENLWGNLRRDADPVPRDNIMFTGFTGAQIAAYHAASGQRDFDAPESLVFNHPSGARFAYSLPQFLGFLERGYGEAPLGLIACEPNWAFPLCNAIGACALQFQDAAAWQRIAPGFRNSFESEFVSPAGAILPCRSSYTGLALPAIGGAVVQAFPCFFLSATCPDLARRHWLKLRAHIITGSRLNRNAFWPVDIGNYRLNRASCFAATATAATEMGDAEAARLLLDAIDEAWPVTVLQGVAHRPKISLWAHAAELMARGGATGAWASLATAAVAGPHIADVPYPQVLVARAVVEAGGVQAVLYPGAEPGRFAIRFGGLTPNRTYAVRDGGGRLTASVDGTGELAFIVERRTLFHLVPEI